LKTGKINEGRYDEKITSFLLICITTLSTIGCLIENPLENTTWRNAVTETTGLVYIIDFDDSGYKIIVDRLSAILKPSDDMMIREYGKYKVSDENRVILTPNIWKIGKNTDPVHSVLGADTLLIEGDTLTVIDGENYKTFSKIN
jgi:hypothetical protein